MVHRFIRPPWNGDAPCTGARVRCIVELVRIIRIFDGIAGPVDWYLRFSLPPRPLHARPARIFFTSLQPIRLLKYELRHYASSRGDTHRPLSLSDPHLSSCRRYSLYGKFSVRPTTMFIFPFASRSVHYKMQGHFLHFSRTRGFLAYFYWYTGMFLFLSDWYRDTECVHVPSIPPSPLSFGFAAGG